MVHPKINLEKLTTQLESIGFEARTKLLFRRGFVDVLIVNGIVPDKIPEDLVGEFEPFFRITITNKSGDIQGAFNCPISEFTILKFG